jgi:hypothetical protein
MGLWKSFLGGGRPSKDDLVRSLAKKRVREDPMAATMGFDENIIDEMGMIQRAGLPENTIGTIVETFALLKKNGVSESEIFARIEAHRSLMVSGQIPNPLSLESYIRYRVYLECSHGAPIADEFLEEAIYVFRQHFGC